MRTKLFFSAITLMAMAELSARDIIINIKEPGFDYSVGTATRTITIDAQLGDVLVFTNNLNETIGGGSPATGPNPYSLNLSRGNTPLQVASLNSRSSYRYTLNAANNETFYFISDNYDAGIFLNNLVNVRFEGGLATNDISAKAAQNLQLYPNPSKGVFSVLGLRNKAKIAVVDANGQPVTQGEISSNNNVNLQHCQNGIYYVLITDGDKQRQLKLIKE